MKHIPILFLFVLILSWIGCQPAEKEDTAGPLKIVCTTGMIADAVARITGAEASVTALMGPGVDPHLYKASQGDLKQLSGADLIFYNGLHLEGKMGEILEKVGKRKPVLPVAESIAKDRLLKLGEAEDTFDPHVWFDVSLWSEVVTFIGASLATQDTVHAEIYRERTAAYLDSLELLDQWVRQEMRTIPAEQRVLITAHDAFAYFGRAYEVEVRGLQGISTVSEYGLKDVSDLVDFI